MISRGYLCEKIMKRITKGIVTMVLSASMIISVPFFGETINAKKSVTHNEHCNKYEEKVWKQYGVGEYPTDEASKEWKEMDYPETVSACELPKDMVTDMSTDDLTEYVLNYPLLIDVYAFDDIESGIEHLKDTSNVCAELFSREDAIPSLIDAYETLDCDYNSVAEGTRLISENGYLQEIFFESYFGYNVEELSRDEKNDIKEIMEDKFDQKNDCVKAFSTATVFFDAAYESTGELQSDMLPENMEEYYEDEENITTLAGYNSSSNYMYNPCNGAWCNYGTYTKYARNAKCYKYISGEYSAIEQGLMDSAFLAAHPSFTYLDCASKKYNCHSYAWINSSSNNFWIDDPRNYAGNTAYFKKLGISSYKAGDKIIFGSATHSVIMTSASKCKSKLGSLGVYKCSLSEALALYGISSGNVSAYRPK